MGCFSEIAKVEQIFIYFYQLLFDEKCAGLRFGRFFYKLIWSPWL
jgi:hypothetical protein